MRLPKLILYVILAIIFLLITSIGLFIIYLYGHSGGIKPCYEVPYKIGVFRQDIPTAEEAINFTRNYYYKMGYYFEPSELYAEQFASPNKGIDGWIVKFNESLLIFSGVGSDRYICRAYMLLFSIKDNQKVVEDLNKGIISPKLKEIFSDNGYPLSDQASVTYSVTYGIIDLWHISDHERLYILEMENGNLNVKLFHPSIKGCIARICEPSNAVNDGKNGKCIGSSLILNLKSNPHSLLMNVLTCY